MIGMMKRARQPRQSGAVRLGDRLLDQIDPGILEHRQAA